MPLRWPPYSASQGRALSFSMFQLSKIRESVLHDVIIPHQSRPVYFSFRLLFDPGQQHQQFLNKKNNIQNQHTIQNPKVWSREVNIAIYDVQLVTSLKPIKDVIGSQHCIISTHGHQRYSCRYQLLGCRLQL